jgi:hypothetical protein
MDELKKYIIVGTDLKFDGKIYPEGREIELTDAEAKSLGDIVQPVEDVEQEGPGNDEIIALINSAESIDAVETLVKDEADKKVIEAASAKIDEFKALQDSSRPSAKEMIKRINESKTVEAVKELVRGEDRTTVLQTAGKKIKTLEEKGGTTNED